MREIKFRAWDNVKKEFMCGSIQMLCAKQRILQKFKNVNRDVDFVLMQYTGLKDRDGKEIFEGDIVEIKYKNYPKFTGKVFWEEHFLSYMVTSPHSAYKCMMLNEFEEVKAEGLMGVYKYNERCYKIIGNIYENPELLGQK